MTEEDDYGTTDAMLQFGGGFVKQLALLYRQADAANRARLRDAFPDYWKTYSQLADRRKQNGAAQ